MDAKRTSACVRCCDDRRKGEVHKIRDRKTIDTLTSQEHIPSRRKLLNCKGGQLGTELVRDKFRGLLYSYSQIFCEVCGFGVLLLLFPS